MTKVTNTIDVGHYPIFRNFGNCGYCPKWRDVDVMNLSKTQRALSLSLAAVMLTSSVSFSMDMHLCQGHIKSVSFFGKVKSCCPNEQSDQCKNLQQTCDRDTGKNNSFYKKPCCVDASLFFQSLEYQAKFDLTNEDKPIMANLLGTEASRSLLWHNLSPIYLRAFHPHQPPLPEGNTIILFQVFLN